ncbi:hypothetical protein CBL_21075, partial [Carabus blaptoides fortunei]
YFNTEELVAILEQNADFERADVFITPPDDGAGSEEDSGDEDDIGDINNLSGRQLRAQATAKLSFKNDLTNIGEDSDEECDIPISELRNELLLMSSKRNWPKTNLQPNFPPFVKPKIQQTIPSDPVACFELFFDVEKLGYGYTGTTMANRIEKCPITSVKIMEKRDRGVYDFCTDTNTGITVTAWNDNRVVRTVSSCNSVEPIGQAT